MKILWNDKDGGQESLVWCWGLEIKSMFSVLLLKFGEGSREAWHTHAFNSYSFLLKGKLKEYWKDGDITEYGSPEFIYTPRERFHQVHGLNKTNWVLTIRGPWINVWKEINENGLQILTHGRHVVRTLKRKTNNG